MKQALTISKKRLIYKIIGKYMIKEKQNSLSIINDINHISLNHSDLIGYFTSYAMDKNNYEDSSYLTMGKISGLLEFDDFIEAASMITRESFVLGITALTLDIKISDREFENMCNECVDIHTQKEYILNVFEDLRYVKGINQDYNLLEIELFKFLITYKKRTFQYLLDKNKVFQIMLKNNSELGFGVLQIIDRRKKIYFSILDRYN